MNITSTLCVGIDVSLDANQVCAMNFDSTDSSISLSRIPLKEPDS